MAGKSGKNGIVKFGSDQVAELTGWSFSEGVGTVDTTVCGDTAETHDTTVTNWSGEVKGNYTAGTGQDIRAGDSVTVEMYSDGDGSGATYHSGTATIESLDLDTPMGGVVTFSAKLKGNGALTSATVA